MFAVVAMENNNNNAVVSSHTNPDGKAMDNAALTNENAELKRKVTTLEADVHSLTEQHQSLQNLIVSKTKQLKDYREQAVRLEGAAKEAQGKLQLNVQQTGAALLLLEEEADSCREDKERAERRAETLAAENETLRRENATLLQRLASTGTEAVAVAAPATPQPAPTSIPASSSECTSICRVLSYVKSDPTFCSPPQH